MVDEEKEKECNCDHIKNINLILMGVLIIIILIFFRRLYIINNTNATNNKLAGIN